MVGRQGARLSLLHGCCCQTRGGPHPKITGQSQGKEVVVVVVKRRVCVRVRVRVRVCVRVRVRVRVCVRACA